MKSTNTINLLSIDPSVTLLGWSLLEYNTTTGSVDVLKFGSLKTSTKLKTYDLAELATIGNTIVAISMCCAYIKELVDTLSPVVVVVNRPTTLQGSPTKFLSRRQCIAGIEQLMYNEYKMPVVAFPDTLTNSTLRGSGLMRPMVASIRNNAKINFKQKKLLESILTQEANAVATGYAFITHSLIST